MQASKQASELASKRSPQPAPRTIMPRCWEERTSHMCKAMFPLVPSDTTSIMKMSASVRVHFFPYISLAHMLRTCTTQHSCCDTVAGKDAPRMRGRRSFRRRSLSRTATGRALAHIRYHASKRSPWETGLEPGEPRPEPRPDETQPGLDPV